MYRTSNIHCSETMRKRKPSDRVLI